MPPTLAPLQTPLGPQPPSPKLYNHQQVTLALKEKVFSLSGDDFTIKTADGVGICKCKGKWISLRASKKFSDMQENEIFTLTNRLMTIHKSFHAESPTGANFEVKGHFKLMGSKSTVNFKNAANGMDVELEIKGDFIDRNAEITFEGRPVAAISRSFFNAREWFGDKQTYFVTVAANVDLSLIAAICIALDERENESS